MCIELKSAVSPADPCEHMSALIAKLGYQRDPRTGKLLFHTCLSVSNERRDGHLRDICGKTSPLHVNTCYVCQGNAFGPPPNPEAVIELPTCCYRCKTCKWVTQQCHATSCLYCGRKEITLLPPVMNRDIYGFKIYTPPTGETTDEMLRRMGLHSFANRYQGA